MGTRVHKSTKHCCTPKSVFQDLKEYRLEHGAIPNLKAKGGAKGWDMTDEEANDFPSAQTCRKKLGGTHEDWARAVEASVIADQVEQDKINKAKATVLKPVIHPATITRQPAPVEVTTKNPSEVWHVPGIQGVFTSKEAAIKATQLDPILTKVYQSSEDYVGSVLDRIKGKINQEELRVLDRVLVS